MLRLLARWLHHTHRNCTIIARSSTNTVDLYAPPRPQTGIIHTRREYSSLATASARQCSTCYGRDGTIASRSINRENNIEALVIFKKIQFALGSPNRYEFYSGAKKKWAAVEKVNKNMYHIPPYNVKTQEVSGRFTLYSRKTTARRCTKNVLQLDLLLFFPVLVKGTQRLFSVKYLFGEANFLLKISRWPFHSRTIFEAHLIMLINSLLIFHIFRR